MASMFLQESKENVANNNLLTQFAEKYNIKSVNSRNRRNAMAGNKLIGEKTNAVMFSTCYRVSYQTRLFTKLTESCVY